MRERAQRFVWRIKEVGIRAFTTATNSPTNLVQLAKAKVLCTINDQRIGIRNIDAGFDNGGGDQHVITTFPKVNHHLFELRLIHLAVGNCDARLWHQLGQTRRGLVDCVDAVVHKKHLAFAN